MFEKNKLKLIKSQQELIESLKRKNKALVKENEDLHAKILTIDNVNEKYKNDISILMDDLKRKQNEYDSLIKDIKNIKTQYSAYLMEIVEINKKYKHIS